jgi:hypothetical protein
MSFSDKSTIQIFDDDGKEIQVSGIVAAMLELLIHHQQEILELPYGQVVIKWDTSPELDLPVLEFFLYHYWPVEAAASLSPKQIGEIRAARVPCARLRGFSVLTQKDPQFTEDRGAVDDIRAALRSNNAEPFFLAIRLYPEDALLALLEDPEIRAIYQGWAFDASRGNKIAGQHINRISKEIRRASYRRPALLCEQRPLSRREAVSRTNTVRRLFRGYQEELDGGQSPQQAYRNVVEHFSIHSRVKDPRRKRVSLGKFDEQIVKDNPSLAELIGRKIWHDMLLREN